MRFFAFTSLILGVGIALVGCATYEKCGFDGCAGDAKITANVRALIDKHPDLEAPDQVGVQTVNHVVYLTGTVSTNLQKSTAEAVARQAKGVTRVEDSISVPF